MARMSAKFQTERKVSRIPRPIKKESDIINQQESVKKGFSISIQQQPAQRRNTIQNLSVLEELVRPEPAPQEENQNVSAAGDRGDPNGIKESMNADQENHNHQMESTTRQEDEDNVEVQQQLSGTVQHELTTGYVTGYLNQHQPNSCSCWSLCPIVFAGSYHVMY